jgi:hypothetical protein
MLSLGSTRTGKLLTQARAILIRVIVAALLVRRMLQ